MYELTRTAADTAATLQQVARDMRRPLEPHEDAEALLARYAEKLERLAEQLRRALPA